MLLMRHMDMAGVRRRFLVWLFAPSLLAVILLTWAPEMQRVPLVGSLSQWLGLFLLAVGLPIVLLLKGHCLMVGMSGRRLPLENYVAGLSFFWLLGAEVGIWGALAMASSRDATFGVLLLVAGMVVVIVAMPRASAVRSF